MKVMSQRVVFYNSRKVVTDWKDHQWRCFFCLMSWLGLIYHWWMTQWFFGDQRGYMNMIVRCLSKYIKMCGWSMVWDVNVCVVIYLHNHVCIVSIWYRSHTIVNMYTGMYIHIIVWNLNIIQHNFPTSLVKTFWKPWMLFLWADADAKHDSRMDNISYTHHGKVIFTNVARKVWCWYCWWKKSCTTWDVWIRVNHGINYKPQLVHDFFHQQYGGVVVILETLKRFLLKLLVFFSIPRDTCTNNHVLVRVV